MNDFRLVPGEETRAIRKAVFSLEQGIPENQIFDEHDPSADFLALFQQGRAVGCGRFYRESPDSFHIDNIALLQEVRGGGRGKALVEELVRLCREKGAGQVTVNARRDAVGFYEKCGFAADGCVFDDGAVRRAPMVRSFAFDGCEWLGCAEKLPAFVARKTFDAEKIKKAVLRVGVLGFVEPYCNGVKLTQEMYIPVLSDYEARDLSGASYPIFDTMCHRRYYLEYDLTPYLKDGKNVIAFHIGNGWYGQDENHAEEMPVWGRTKLIFRLFLTNEDGSETELCSDETVKYTASYIKRTNIYINETMDGRDYDESVFSIDYDDADCRFMTPVSVSPAVLCRQDFSGDTVARSLTPVLLHRDGDTRIYDLGEDVSGLWIVRFCDSAKPGDTAFVTMAEVMDEEYRFRLRHTGGEERKQCDTYICGAEKRKFSPVFTWRAGRFVRLEGNAELVRFDVAHSPVPVTAKLRTGNENLRWLFEAYCRTQNCNIHAMIPSDCPHRERLGYTGDGQLCSAAAMTIFDSKTMYRKWLDDIADCQDIDSGHVQHTAPFLGGGGGPGGWGGAMVIVPWNYYKKFGDISVLKKYYTRMKRYLDYMQAHSENGIVVREEEHGWCLGDWCPPNNDIRIPPEFVNTYFYIKCMQLVRKSASLLRYADDVRSLETQIERVSAALVRDFFDAQTGSFCDGVQGADAFALDIGLGDERTKENLVRQYIELGHYDTGIFGTDILTRILFETGHASLAWQLLTNDSEISFSYMRRHGATTLWENWDGCDSLSHPMFGAVTETIFTYILGIRQTEDSAGYEKVRIDPAYLPESGDIAGSIMTPNGRIAVEISYRDGIRAVRYSAPEKTVICD